MIIILLGILSILEICLTECPNGCSGRGKCGAYDSCTCYKGWFGNDCSQRLCLFGRAHIDSPLGDLDASGDISVTPILLNSQIYPYGTSELYPVIADTKGQKISQSAHYYMECSSKGLCDRTRGVCNCFDGYEGGACERLVCPGSDYITGVYVNDAGFLSSAGGGITGINGIITDDGSLLIGNNGPCNGHGVCISAREMAKLDDDNIYELWDKHASIGCLCDQGYSGADCSERACKYGTDPLYLQNAFVNPRTSNFSFVIFTNSSTANITGEFSLIFYDDRGDDWISDPIQFGASCFALIQTLESLPNSVIPPDSIRCLQWPDYHTIVERDEPLYSLQNPYYGIKYTLVFAGNKGRLRQPEIFPYLDGRRPTLYAVDDPSKRTVVNWYIYANGFHGEDSGTDMFPDLCRGVVVTLNKGDSFDSLGDLSALEQRLLEKCLGDADGDMKTSSERGSVTGKNYDWDYGSFLFPHVIKLVEATDPSLILSDMCNKSSRDSDIKYSSRGTAQTCVSSASPVGFYAAIYFDPESQVFRVMTRATVDYSSATEFVVFTTNGTLGLVSPHVLVHANGARYSQIVYTTNSTDAYPGYLGNVHCESNKPNMNGALLCVERGDSVILLDPSPSKTAHSLNPGYPNMYRVIQITARNGVSRIKLDMGVNFHLDKRIGYSPRLYTFKPPKDGGYNYYSACGGHGICDVLTGECDCQRGFVGVDCSIRDLSFSQ